uniref:Fructose-bisphosphate aldolase n=1 Tax=Eufriesea mexicana TaxID=516756 RepID=A0A310SH69_9HYME
MGNEYNDLKSVKMHQIELKDNTLKLKFKETLLRMVSKSPRHLLLTNDLGNDNDRAIMYAVNAILFLKEGLEHDNLHITLFSVYQSLELKLNRYLGEYIQFEWSASTIPYQHGDVFVSSDGDESDLNLGHNERFTDEDLTRHSIITARILYQAVLKKERDGLHEGKTVQVVPPATDKIKKHIFISAIHSNAEVITEVGATVEGTIKFMGGFNTVASMTIALLNDSNITISVALHSVHGKSVYSRKKPLDACFSSVTLDGPHVDFYENIRVTMEVVTSAKELNASVKAEANAIRGQEDGAIGSCEIASDEYCPALATLGNDFLADGINNFHGKYPKN